MDFRTCISIATHKKQSSQNIYIPGIVWAGLRFTQPLIWHSQNIYILGIVWAGLCFTQRLIWHNLEVNHPAASSKTSLEFFKKKRLIQISTTCVNKSSGNVVYLSTTSMWISHLSTWIFAKGSVYRPQETSSFRLDVWNNSN